MRTILGTSSRTAVLALFAAGMIGLGILALVYGDFAMGWQPVAAWVPGRTGLAYGAGVVMLLGGIGLLFRATAVWAVRILFLYLIVWALLKVPALFAAPRMEAVWLGFGELTALLAGGWILFAWLADLPDGSVLAWATGERGIRMAQILFGVSLLPIGLSHLVYTPQTVDLVPAWLPFRTGWAYLTGVGQIACGLGVLFSVYPRIAAWAEAGMVGVFTIFVWLPAIVAAPGTRLPWTAFLVSWIIASGAGLVAGSIPKKA